MIARIAHEVNRVHQDEDGANDWETCPQWQRDNTLKAVNRLLVDPSVTDDTLRDILNVDNDPQWDWNIKLLRAVVHGAA